MKSNKPLAIVTGLVALWTVTLAVHLGCDATDGIAPAAGITGSSEQSVNVTAFFSDKPMYFAPNSAASRSNFVDISSQMPAEVRTATFAVQPDFLDVEVEAIPPSEKNGFTIELAVSDRLVGEREIVGTFEMEITRDGFIRVVAADTPEVSPKVIEMLQRRDFIIDTDVVGDFTGGIKIGQTDIKVLIGGFDGSNSNTDDGNANDDAGNANDGGNANDAGGNTNDNTGDNTNDNTGDNANDNTGDNTNDNTGDNTNDNTADNMNDNSVDGICPDGSIQLRTRIDGPDDFEIEVEYRENGESCRRFRLDISGFASGWYDVFANDVFVGEIFAGAEDGEGRLRLETDDGNMPADFPFLGAGDIVSIGDVIDVTLQVHCSEIWSCDNANGNDNTDGNTNDNTGGNTNGNTGDNSNDNTGDNTNMNG